ncbi:MAG: DUF4336 domain-containing protein [Cyanobacteria bacterium J06638_20]
MGSVTDVGTEWYGSDNPADWRWNYWWLVPIYPYGKRRTLCREIVPETIWIFEQVQGIFYVTVPIRMTVVRLESGGLLVYAPIAPTRECIRWMRSLEDRYGVVKYVVLPTVSGIEHKVFVGPFARRFPQAQVYVAPHQWSYPVDLPLSWLGLPGGRTQRLPDDPEAVPFTDEFDYAILGPIQLGLGNFEEVALFHRRSRTLLLTDTLVSVPDHPPAITQLDPYPLLFHARDDAFEAIEDTEANRRKGWQRTALFSFYFRPDALDTVTLGQSFRESLRVGDRSRRAFFGIYPFRWKPHWQQSFEALRGNGRPFVAPILQTLILNRDPAATLGWVDQVAQWEFQHIIPAHLDAPLEIGADAFRNAFRFLYPEGDRIKLLPDADFELLRELDVSLSRRGITPPVPPSLKR